MARGYRFALVVAGSVLGMTGPGCSGPGPAPAARATASMRAQDVDGLTGGAWAGTLTYLDYTSGKPYTMPATLAVERIAGAAEPSWRFRVGYPDEPKANAERLVVLAGQGSVFDGETVVERTEEPGGVVRVVTEAEGEDDRRPARFRHEYEFGPGACSIRKLVRFEGESAFFERNTFRWRR